LKKRFINWWNTFTLPGFERRPVRDVLNFLWHEMGRDSIFTRSASVAYSFSMSLFPFLLVLLTIIPYLPIPKIRITIMQYLKSLMPVDAYHMVNKTMTDILSNHHNGLLSVSIFLAVFFAARGVVGLLNAFNNNKSYAEFRRKKIIPKYILALKITLFLFLLLMGSVLIIAAGDALIKWIMDLTHAKNSTTFLMLNIVKWLVVLSLYFVGTSLIYYYGSFTKTRWKFITPGSIVASVLSVLTCLLFSSFINHFGNYNKIYGSIGAIIVLMGWMYYNAMVLIIGFELNASIAITQLKTKTQTEKKKASFTNTLKSIS
jgi:membrane protein